MHRQRFCRLGRGVAIARRGTGRGDADRSAEKVPFQLCRFWRPGCRLDGRFGARWRNRRESQNLLAIESLDRSQVRHSHVVRRVPEAAESRLADLDLLLVQRQAQIEELQQQRDFFKRERHDAQGQNQILQQELHLLRLKAEQERITQENYLRGVEDRAHREVDRAREEGTAAVSQSKVASRRCDDLRRRLESAQSELSQAEQRTAAQLARAETLEQQLIQIRQLSEIKRKPRVRKNRHQATLKTNRRCQLAAIREPSKATAIGHKRTLGSDCYRPIGDTQSLTAKFSGSPERR